MLHFVLMQEMSSGDDGYRRTRSKKVFSPFVITPRSGEAIQGPWDFNIMDALQEENHLRMEQEDRGDGYPSEDEVELEDEVDWEIEDLARLPLDGSTEIYSNVASTSASATSVPASPPPWPTHSPPASSPLPVVATYSPPAASHSTDSLSPPHSFQHVSAKAAKRAKHKITQRAKRNVRRLERDSQSSNQLDVCEVEEQQRHRAKRRRTDTDACELEEQPRFRPKRIAIKKAAAAKTYTIPDVDMTSLPVSSAGWTGRRQMFVREHSDLQEAFRQGMYLLDWQGDDTHAIIDKNNVVISVLGAPPPGQNKSDWNGVVQAANAAIKNTYEKISFTQKEANHRRGDFPAVACGISFGGGQKRPGVLKHSTRTNNILRELLASSAFRRISGYANSLFATFAPRTYNYYVDGLAALRQWNPRLRTNFARTAFAACTWNFGPFSVSYPHTDNGNVAFGWCAITALGDYDPDQGGHLILWDLGLVIRFPPGATILIPSALLVHSNVPIQEGETRYSFVQYSAGGLFRWRYNGFQTEERWRSNASSSELKQAENDRKERARRGFAMFSKFDEIVARYKQYCKK